MGPIEFGARLNAIVENINSSSIDTFLESISEINKLLNIAKQTDRYKECLDILRSTLEHEYVIDTNPEIDYSKALNYSKTMTADEKANYLVQNLRMVLGEQLWLKVVTSASTHDRLKAPLKQNRYRIQSENFRDEGTAIVDLLKRIHGEKDGISFKSCKISDISEALRKQGKSHEFSIATIDGKKFIIDLSYRQFFTITDSNAREGTVNINPAIFMLQDDNKKFMAKQMLRYGFIEATPENLKNYFESIIMASLGKDVTSQEIRPIEVYEKYLSQEKTAISNKPIKTTTQQNFICDSTPYIQSHYDDEYNVNMTDEEILTGIVQKERRHLMKEHDIMNEGLFGECEGSTKRVMLDCTSKGFDAVFLSPGYYLPERTKIIDGKSISVPPVEGHNCTFINLNGKDYIIDCTYRQFFRDDGKEHCGKYMLTEKSRKHVAEQILKYGWIEATPENIKAYMDGFEMARMKSFEDTGISADEYIKRLTTHKDFPISISEGGVETSQVSLQDAIKKFTEQEGQLEAENDLEIVCQIDSYLMDNPQISTEEFSMFIDDLLLGIGEQFANDTRVKDTKTRIEEFNKKIYTIAEHPRFQQMTSRDETGRNLYGRVLEFLQTEQYPTGREYKPSKDKRQTMNETDLENRDYNIRKKWLEHFISRYNIPESISANFMVASEQFYENADNTLSLNFGRMNMNEAPIMTRILFDLGYKVNFDDLLKGGQISAKKIPLIMEKRRESKTGVQFGKESIGIYQDPCFSSDVLKRVQQYQEGVKATEKYFRKSVDMPEIKHYDEQGIEIDE